MKREEAPTLSSRFAKIRFSVFLYAVYAALCFYQESSHHGASRLAGLGWLKIAGGAAISTVAFGTTWWIARLIDHRCDQAKGFVWVFVAFGGCFLVFLGVVTIAGKDPLLSDVLGQLPLMAWAVPFFWIWSQEARMRQGGKKQ